MKTTKGRATTPAKKSGHRRALRPGDEISINVRPEDKDRLIEIARTADIPLAAATNAAMRAGYLLNRYQDIAHALKEKATFPLWRCIHRCKADYSETALLSIDSTGYFYSAKEDAKSMGRTFADWGGTLVRCGLTVISSAEGMKALAEAAGEPLWEQYAHACAFNCRAKGGAA